MRPQKIMDGIELLKVQLKKNRILEYDLLYELQSVWQDTFDLERPDVGTMYDESLKSNVSNRLWKGRGYDAKSLMVRLGKLYPDLFMSMFEDLFDEGKDLEGRVSRFAFHSDELLRAYRSKNKSEVITSHFHESGWSLVLLYLSMNYSRKYCFCRFDEFKYTMDYLGSRKLPTPSDFQRYVKVCRTLYKFLKEDQELMDLLMLRFSVYQWDSMLCVSLFIGLIGKQKS